MPVSSLFLCSLSCLFPWTQGFTMYPKLTSTLLFPHLRRSASVTKYILPLCSVLNSLLVWVGSGAGEVWRNPLFSKGREPTSACLNLQKSLVFSVVLTVIILSKAEARLKKDHKVCLVAAFKNKKRWLCTMLSTAGSLSFSTFVSPSLPHSLSGFLFPSGYSLLHSAYWICYSF